MKQWSVAGFGNVESHWNTVPLMTHFPAKAKILIFFVSVRVQYMYSIVRVYTAQLKQTERDHVWSLGHVLSVPIKIGYTRIVMFLLE